MLDQGAKRICRGLALSTMMIVTVNQTLLATINVSIDDFSGPPGLLSSIIRVNGDLEFDSASIALGSELISGNDSSKIRIKSFETTGLIDSAWSGSVLMGAAPQLPATESVLSMSQNRAAGPSGALLRVTFDATETQPGDVFQLDPNFFEFSKFSLGETNLVDEARYASGTLTIVDALEGIPGDYNGDQMVDAADIILLTEAVRNQSNNPLYDADKNGVVNNDDRDVWVNDIKRTYYGDANLDLKFNSDDIVQMFVAGEYLDDIAGNSTWVTGDANGDGDFTPEDFVTMFVAGGYLLGERPPAAIAAVPEPSSVLLLGAASCILMAYRRYTNKRQS